jgi:hypothetical protein
MMKDVTMGWDWLGGLSVRREETRTRAASERSAVETPPAVDIRLASGSVVRISFDQATRRMSLGRIQR